MLDGTRHLFALPRGRGPSQTPPSLATDSSISPGPPLSLAADTVHQCRVPAATPPVGTVNARRAGNAGGKPPAGHHSGRSSQCRKGSSPPRPRRRQAPTGYLLGRLCKCRRRFNAGVPGAKPPAKYTLNPPFPTGEGGWGDRGQKRQLTAGQAGDKESPLPVGYPSGRSNKCRPGFSPRRGRTPLRSPQRQWHAAPAAKNFPLPLDAQHKK